jgi:probable HAF family extracellular repeat protein
MTSRRVVFITALLVACVPLVGAQGTYTQIDYPGSIGTICNGTDNAGDIVGSYADSGNNTHAFLLSGGTYTALPDYEGITTVATGINDVGQIVGWNQTAGGNSSTGFVYDLESQTFTEVMYPGALWTYPVAINNSGTVVGYYAVDFYADWTAFMLLNNRYIRLAVNGTYPELVGITQAGVATGTVAQNNVGWVNFTFEHGKLKEIPALNGYIAQGVDSSGSIIVGFSGLGGFIYQNKILRQLQFPGASFTYAVGVNDTSEVSGYFEDASSNYHGFTWTPPADAGKK